MIVAMRGHATTDAVVANTANVIRQSTGDTDICARLGEGEFMIFSTDCDVTRARDIAERICARLSRGEPELAEVKASVSIGIAVHDGTDTDFSRMYRDADAALYQASVEGDGYSVVFTTSRGEQKHRTRRARSHLKYEIIGGASPVNMLRSQHDLRRAHPLASCSSRHRAGPAIRPCRG